MASKVKSDEMAAAITKVLSEYEGATIENIKNAVDKASKKAVDQLNTTSPKRTGAYAKDWASKSDKQKNKWAYAKTVYNKKHYRLTHLLEKGHRKVGGGFVAARPHIYDAEQEAIEELYKDIKDGV